MQRVSAQKRRTLDFSTSRSAIERDWNPTVSLPPRLVIYGVAAYAMNTELSLNIAASIEGWFIDHWSWKWIFWDTALLTPFLMVCVHFGMPRQPTNRALLLTD